MSTFTASTSWTAEHTVSASGTKTITISTAKKYVDRDIVIKVKADPGSVSKVTVNGSTSCSYKTASGVTTAANDTSSTSQCYVTFESSSSVTSAPATTVAGYITAGDKTPSSITKNISNGTGKIYIDGVTLAAANGRSFKISTPGSLTFTFKTDASGNVWVE